MRKIVAALAILPGFMLAQPCPAADDFRELQGAERRGSAFAGASFRVGLGGEAVHTPTLRLKLSMRQVFRHRDPAAPAQARELPAVELGLDRSSRPVPYFAGRSPADMKRKANLLGATHPVTVALITALVVTAAFVLSQDLDGEPASDTGSPSS